MKKKPVVLSIARVLVTAALASTVVFSAAEAGAAQVRLNGVPASAAPGAAFTAELVIDTGSTSIPLGSYSVTISWSPDLLTPGTSTGGATLEFSGLPFSNTGTAQVVVAGFNLMSLTEPGGVVSVARIPFTISGAATGQDIDLSFSNVVVSDPNGVAIPVNTLGASIVVGGECGNGVVEDGESCDDGNNIAGDCCADDCTAEVGACDDASVCTTGDACSAAGVCEGTALDCSDGNACTDDICDPTSGCLNLTNNGACNDGDPCTSGDQCVMGVCVSGGPTTCDDSNACTTDSCAAEIGCLFVPGLVDCNDDNGCTDDICDPSSGCVNSNNSLSCDDGSACTTDDTCTAGSCVGGLPPGCDDGNNCTLDGCDDAAGCVNTVLSDGSACLDGDFCNGAETCQAGSCTGGSAVDCDDLNSCTDDGCDSLSGCVNVAVTDGTTCADGDACNGDETCQSGACSAGSALNCDDANLCTTDSCDAGTGCANAAMADGSSCADGDACNGDETCQSANCAPGAAVDCSDGDACTIDTCSPADGSCSRQVSNDAVCPDAQVRLEGVPASLVPGADFDAELVIDTGSASEFLGAYSVDLAWPAALAVLNSATGGSVTEFSGALVANIGSGTATLAAFQGSSMTSPSGAVHVATLHFSVAVDAPAGSSLAISVSPLTVSDVDGEGMSTSATGATVSVESVCGNGIVELAEQCDDGGTAGGDCCSAACALEIGSCDDGDACTANDTCVGETCVSDAPTVCDDDDLCTDDNCNSSAGCDFVNNTVACDDGSACTTQDFCFLGSCFGTQPPNCDDNNGCTDDSCEALSGCANTSNTAACEDGNACTTSDTCSAGSCVGGAAPNCDDSNGCTDDSCDNATGCVNAANVASCDDGLFCNGDDVCAAGECGHAGDPCAAGAVCNNACDEVAESCLNPAATSCTGNPDTCTLEQCDGLGACVPAPTGIENAGPVNPDNGFPGYYVDTAGIALELCLEPGACFDPLLELPDPSAPVSFPANFPEEAFWWMGEAVLATPAGGQLRLSMGLEGAFGGGVVSVGDQIAFTRVRIRGGGLSPFASYVMSHPYGTETVVADALGEINFTEDIDIFGLAAVAPGDGGIGPFLVWDDGTAPLGTIGNPLVPHTVTGSPCNQNFFRVDGPGLGTASLETDLFSVLGHTVDPCGNGFVDYGEQCDDGNTLDGDCCTSSCGLVAAATACTDHDVCTDNGVCDGLGATCPVASFTVAACDDGDACTTTDTCDAGTCVGGVAPVCDDGSFCTGVESCDSALGCVDNADPVADDGVDCTDDSCDDINGVIVNAVNDGFCDDGQFCTGEETCDATLGCQDNADPNANDGVGCTDDSCDEVNDEIINAVNHASCDDSLYCNGVESCDAVLDCQDNIDPDPNDGVACTVDTCDEATNSLVNTTNHGACDDGQFCTGVESCDAVLGCQDNDDPDANDGVGCTDDSCDEVNNVIVNAVNDANCDDALFCNGAETCDSTLDCQDGADPDADDGVTCTDDSCDEAGDVIVNAVNDANCDDGLYCTGVETCDATADCQDGADPDADDGVGCTDDSCDEDGDVIVNAVNDGNCEDGNLCTSDSCDAVSDCLNANNTLACDDDNACTTGDVCAAGACDGVDTSVVDCEDDNLCTDDSCDVAVGCVNGDNVLACDDGNACTTADTCADGACLGGVAPDCDDANGCTDDFCNSIDGCINASNVVPCDDSDACTTEDKCSGGSCVGGVAPVCDDGLFCTGVESCDTVLGCQDNIDPDPNDGVGCTDDSCDELNDVIVNAVNDGLCDDLQFCTGVETCHATMDCQDGTDPDPDDGVGCTDDSCDEVNNVIVNAVNDGLCDDLQFCTGVETCHATMDCQGGTDPDPDDGVGCTDDSCDEDADVIVNAANDANCDDALFCNGAETCDATMDCQDGTDPFADDGVFCTDDSCDELNDVIVNAANDANCDDGLYCTGVETCDAAADCQDNADPVADDGVACTDDSCDEVHDVIVNAVNDGLCDDLQFCTGVETCHATMDCQDNADPNADDGVGCTDDSCDEVNDVIVNAVNDSSCDDGQFCTGVETCHATMDCQDNADPTADDGVGCTDDSCDEVNDVIVNAVNDSSCDDGQFCTGVETCDAVGDCQDNADPDPDDGVGCTDDSCDEVADEIVNAVNDGACDDGLYCTGVETCDATADCQDNADPDPDDGVGCTDDSCNELTDSLVNAVNDGNCDDGQFCTGVETCHATMDCQDNADPNADDGVGCTDDSCDEVNDVIVNAVNDSSCDDGQFCTGVETCHATMDCQDNADPNADDGVGCTDDSCDEETDSLVNAVNDGNCDDGQFCTGVETCDATADCQDGTDPDPDDGVECTDDSCDEETDSLVNAVNDGNCDDGLYCTGVETCDATADCQDNVDPDPDDGVECTDDSCDEETDSLVNAVNDGNCDDGLYCTGVETCDATADCQDNGDPDPDDGVDCTLDSCDEETDSLLNVARDPFCDDGNGCTDDSCDSTQGCHSEDNAASCDDGDACTVSDQCSGGSCQPGSAADCDDGNVCTDDACDSVLGCHSVDNDVSCDDGNACTLEDSCDGGGCVPGDSRQCEDENTCTDDSCDPVEGCVFSDNATSCDDDDPCTGEDLCGAGSCLGIYLVTECCGDPDSSGGVGVSDALRILQNAVGMDVLCPLALCDVNGSGSVTASDALMALRVAVGTDLELQCELPAPPSAE